MANHFRHWHCNNSNGPPATKTQRHCVNDQKMIISTRLQKNNVMKTTTTETN